MAAFTSKADGDWDTGGAAVWNEYVANGNRAPESGDTVTISHAITKNSDLVWAAGTITATAPSASLTMSANKLTVKDGGLLAGGSGTFTIYDLEVLNTTAGGYAINTSGTIRVTHAFTTSNTTAKIKITGGSALFRIPSLPGNGGGVITFEGAVGGYGFILDNGGTWQGYAVQTFTPGTVSINGDFAINDTGSFGFIIGNSTQFNVAAGKTLTLKAGCTWSPTAGSTLTLNAGAVFNIFGTYTPGATVTHTGQGLFINWSTTAILNGTINARVNLMVTTKVSLFSISIAVNAKIKLMRRDVKVVDGGSGKEAFSADEAYGFQKESW